MSGQDQIAQNTTGTEATTKQRTASLEQGWWKQLSESQNPDEAAKSWAPLMIAMTQDLDIIAESCVVFLTDPAGGRLRVVAAWPENRIPGSSMLSAAETAIEQGRGVVRGALPNGPVADDENSGGLVTTTTPLMINGEALGAVGMEIRPAGQVALVSAMRRLQWGSAWMRDLLRRGRSEVEDSRYEDAVNALNIVIGIAEREDFPTAARAAVTDLALRFNCDRVSVGFLRHGQTRVSAISHSAQFAKQMSLTQSLGEAMDEAIDQRAVVLFPDDNVDEPLVVHCHEALVHAHGGGHVLSAPMYANGEFVGAVTFERPETRPFNQDDLEILEAAVTVLAPILNEKRLNDRWLIAKIADAAVNQFSLLVGPGRLARKAVAFSIVLLFLFFWFVHTDYRVAADAIAEVSVQRVIVAKYDGFISEAPVRPGDQVEEGDLLVRLDDRDLVLDRLRLVTARQQQKLEYDRAVAKRDRAESLIRESQIKQANAKIYLVDQQIERSRLRAPFNGVIVAGDLSQTIGAAVGRGDPLLTVAPLDAYRITLRVLEQDIGDIKKGQ